jgi:hypothetical protein
VKRVAIVTGVSKGLGEAVAAALLARGWEVTGIGRSASARLAAAAPAFRLVACDFAAIDGVDAALAPAFAAIAAARPVAVCLVNNAATAEPVGVAGGLDAAALVRALGVNLAAPVVVANAFVRHCVNAAAGADCRVVNVSSGLAVRAVPGAGAYSIAKAGLEMLTKMLDADVAAPSFRAITLRPGIIDTPMQEFMRARSDAEMPSAPMFREFHASGRLADPDALAARIVSRLIEAPVERGRTYDATEL